MSKLLPYSLAVAALWPASHAVAQAAQEDVTVADLKRTDIVVVATGVDQLPEDSGRAVTVLDRATIETRQTTVVSDLLATVPGVTVTRNGGVGGFTGVRIRGAESEQTLVLIDGVRVNDPSSPGGGFDFANLLAGAVERIDVLRGPNAVAWGSQAIGGVVNVVTASGTHGLAGRVNVEGGSLDTVSANAALLAGGDRYAASLTGGYYYTGGISAAANGSEPDGYRQAGVTGRVRAELADGFGVDLRAYYADSRSELDGYPPPAYAFADTPEYSTAKEFYGHAGLFLNLADGAFANRASVTIARIDRDNFDPSAGSGPAFLARGRSERYSYHGDYRPIDRVRLAVGAEHEDSRFTDGTTLHATGITSVYGEAIVTPLDVLTVTGGVRHDDHRTFGGHTSFGADATLLLPSDTRLRASYGEGFKAPTLYQLFSYYGRPSLRPETAKSYDVGVIQTLPFGSIGVTWFHRDTRDQIDFDLATYTYSNIASTRARGVEVELALRPVTGLDLTGSYTHVLAENRSAGANFGNDLGRRPRDSGSVSIDYRLASGPSFGGTLLVVGDSFDDAANRVPLRGYALAGIRASVPLGRQIDLYGRVENLFDKRYQTVFGYGTAGRTAYLGLRARIG